MKRFFLLLLIATSFLNIKGQKLKIGVNADPQFSWFSSDESSISPNGAVFHIHPGLEMNYFFQENYAFSFGIGINNTGGNLMYSDTTYYISKGDSLTIPPNSNLKHRIQYLDFPVGLTLKTEELGYLTFTFRLGLTPMININANITSDNNELEKKDIKESINLFNLNYFVGVSAEYRLGGNTALSGGLRWSSGFTDVTNNDNANITLNALAIHIGVLF